MSEINITIPGGKKKRLLTAGKYCPSDILVTAEGSVSRLPEGYTELEYIESSGDLPHGEPYIDTGVVPSTNDFSVAMRVATTGATSAENWFLTVNYSKPSGMATFLQFGTWSSKFTVHLTNVTVNGSTAASANVVDITFGVSGTTASLTGDANYSVTDASFKSGTYRNSTITILNGNWKCYACQIYLGGTLVRDYVPCRNPYGVVGLYDLVNCQFYGNAGTGAFTGVPIAQPELPIGYTKLNYIQSSGTQYVDTGFTANQNTSATIKFSTTQQSNGGILVAMQGWRNRGFGIFVNAIIFGSSTTDRTGMFGDGNIHEVKLASAQCYDNGSLIWSGSVSTFTTPATLTICKSNVVSEAHEYSSAKIYSCQIYDSGLLVRDYVPCTNPSGVYGLYDLANGVFYQNAGSGSFTGA